METLEGLRRPRVSFRLENKTVTQAQQEIILGIDAEAQLFPGVTGGFHYAANQTDIDSVRLEDGSLGSFAGLRRRSEVFLSYHLRPGGFIKTSLLTDGSRVGTGLRFQRPDFQGLFDLVVDYKRPNWDFIEGIVNGTLRDRFQLRRVHRIGNGFSALASLVGNRYRTDQYPSAARSVGFEAALTYELPDYPLSFVYGVESEYELSVATAKDLSGVPFHPIPLVSREVHFFDMAFWRRWTPACWTEGFAGYSVDRLGGTGPFIGANLKCEPRKGLGGHVWLDQRLDTADTRQVVRKLWGTLFWRF
jgi:hypothetical protein